MNFSDEILKIDPAKRCVQGLRGAFQNWPANDCFFGVPSDRLYGRNPLKKIPTGAGGFHFYLGADSSPLILSFVTSQYPASSKRLHVGASCYGSSGVNLDYSALTKILTSAEFPQLEVFEFGVWQLFSNSHCLYGTLGDVTALLRKMPNLKTLFLFGNFELSNSFELNKLKALSIITDDPFTHINGGAQSPRTVSNLLNSAFHNLEDAYIDLAVDDDKVAYPFPESFLAGEKYPSIQKLEIVGAFSEEQAKRLKASDLAMNLGPDFCLELS